jgi:hypothetical protein
MFAVNHRSQQLRQLAMFAAMGRASFFGLLIRAKALDDADCGLIINTGQDELVARN